MVVLLDQPRLEATAGLDALVDRIAAELVGDPVVGVAVGEDLAGLAPVEPLPRLRVGGEVGAEAKVAGLGTNWNRGRAF